MKKKFVLLLLTVSMIIGSFTAVSASWDSEANILTLLNGLKIMQGDGNGNYRLDDYVSRAEFAKVAVAASAAKDTVAFGLKISPFKDVKYKDWFAPYVHAAVTAKLCEGYVDGTFRPNQTVSYEEAVTMLLRALGYSQEDFGVSWPYGQVGMAQNLEMTKGVGGVIGEKLTRRQVARLLYNTLDTKQKGTGNKLISIFDCTTTSNVKIVASHNEDSSLAADEIYTTAGILEIDESFDYSWVGGQGDIIVKNGNDLVAFMPNSSGSTEKYIIYSMLQNAVIGYKDGVFKQIDIKDTVTCYKSTQQTTFGSVKNEMEMGDILYVRTDNGTVDYVSYAKGDMQGPVKVAAQAWTSQFNTNASTQIMRDGNKVSASEILVNDIVYFSKDLNMVLAYTDKITGIYESASPTKDAPASVKISGKEYKIESVEAFNALSSSGVHKIGDTITILLGKSGDIAGVIGAEDNTSATAGYVTGCGTKTYTNNLGQEYSSYYVTLAGTDGTQREYRIKTDASYYVGKICRVTFSGGEASISGMNNTGNAGGNVYADEYKIGTAKVSGNVRIIDTALLKINDMASYKRVYLQRLNGLNLESSKVLYCEKNSAGEITDLILNDVTGDAYSYGIITDKTASGFSVSGDGTQNKSASTFTLDVNGSQRTYSGYESLTKRTPVKVYMSTDGAIQSISNLRQYSGDVSKITHTTAVIDNSTYKLSDDIVIYKIDSSNNVMRITIDDAVNGNYKYTAYYDKEASQGGRIRVIMVR